MKGDFTKGAKAVFFDLDGTLCDVRWRLRVLEKIVSKTDMWDMFNSLCAYDREYIGVLGELRRLQAAGVAVFIFTGRYAKVFENEFGPVEVFRNTEGGLRIVKGMGKTQVQHEIPKIDTD